MAAGVDSFKEAVGALDLIKAAGLGVLLVDKQQSVSIPSLSNLMHLTGSGAV